MGSCVGLGFGEQAGRGCRRGWHVGGDRQEAALSPCGVSPPCSYRRGEPVWRVVYTDDPQLMVHPKTLCCCLVAQSCLTLLRPHGDRQAPLSMGFSRQEYRSGLSFPSPGDLHNPGTEPPSPVLADRFFITEPPGKQFIFHGDHTLNFDLFQGKQYAL